ncbi:hypothetical protein KKD19_05670 [Patescibacteria group bacterium]|nr:hypothetical protein [Patescibacteria group bacterium]MBU4512693.1 hypothetical protein [Patescibacteria group bacterium]MCG2693595.1 hypothetical protein [Candidatus Parcubacteria bacterium]
MKEKKKPACPLHPKVELKWVPGKSPGGWGTASSSGGRFQCPISDCLLNRSQKENGAKTG